MITRRTIISTACGFVLTMGLVIILVLIFGSFVSYFPLSAQKRIPLFIFVLSLLVVVPLLSKRLNRLDSVNKMIGWTFAGIGVEFMAFPFSILLAIKSAGSLGTVMVSVIVITYSVIFGIPAGLISIILGIYLTRRR